MSKVNVIMIQDGRMEYRLQSLQTSSCILPLWFYIDRIDNLTIDGRAVYCLQAVHWLDTLPQWLKAIAVLWIDVIITCKIDVGFLVEQCSTEHKMTIINWDKCYGLKQKLWIRRHTRAAIFMPIFHTESVFMCVKFVCHDKWKMMVNDNVIRVFNDSLLRGGCSLKKNSQLQCLAVSSSLLRHRAHRRGKRQDYRHSLLGFCVSWLQGLLPVSPFDWCETFNHCKNSL